jgi:predicted DNA-binding protein with PD1-like motif
MRERRIDPADARAWLLVFDPGDEVIGTLTAFARRAGVGGGSFTAIGAFSRAEVAFFDLASREYEPIAVDEQVEVLSLAGNVALAEGEVKVHAHAVLGRRDGSTVGGHLLAGVVRPTLELVLQVAATAWQRRRDEATGLPLLAP